MTAINAIRQRKQAFLYADTAFCDVGTGVVMAFASKILAGSHFPWAVAITAGGDPKDWGTALDGFDPRNVAALKRELPGVIEAFDVASRDRGVENASLRLTIAAWCARTATPRIFSIGNKAAALTEHGDTGGQVLEFDYLFGSELDQRHLWKHKTPNDPKCFDPDVDGLAALEERRRAPYEFAGQTFHWVGGTAEQAVISRDGVELYELHRWPDVVGEPIRLVA